MALCYKDKTFCSDGQTCANATQCWRFMSDDEWAKAVTWSKGLVEEGQALVAWSSFKDSCPYYKEKTIG